MRSYQKQHSDSCFLIEGKATIFKGKNSKTVVYDYS